MNSLVWPGYLKILRPVVMMVTLPSPALFVNIRPLNS